MLRYYRIEIMTRHSISFLILICVVKISNGQGSEAFSNDLIATESFFEKLTNDYGSILSDRKNVTKDVDEKISEFVKTLRSPIHWRHRRHLNEKRQHADNGVGVLNGFSPIFENPFPNVLGITIFTHYDGTQLQRFAATLNNSRISLYLYNGNKFEEISLYPITNGSSLIADCSELGCILVISKIDASVTVLRLQSEPNGFFLRPVQYLRGFGNVRLSIWHGMNQLYLGIASSANISIYHWLGEHFDSIQVLDYITEKLTPFKIGSSLYLAVTGARSSVFKFFLQTNTFVLAQRLPLAHDIESFYMKKGHQEEHYLVLSNQASTVIYKFVNDHFMPFQNIAKADKILSITTEETVLLLSLTGNLLKIHQYDGWRFIELDVTVQDVGSIHSTTLDGEIILIVRHTNGVWEFNKLTWVREGTSEVLRHEINSWCLETIEKTRRQISVVPKINQPVRILRGSIGKLKTKSVNGKDTKQLVHLSNRFEELRLNLTANEQVFSKFMTKKNAKFNALHASDVVGKFKSGCKINKLETSVKSPVLERLARPNTMNKNLQFENVKARSTGNLPCPKSAVKFISVTVGGAINGIGFEYLQENLLRATGEQEVTGEHIYENLSVSSALIPLEIATRSTLQELHMHSVKANNLYLTQGGILLPLNGQAIVINETKTLSKVKVTGPVHVRGNVNGEGVNHLAPVTWIEQPLLLSGNYSLQKVTVQNQASGLDLKLNRMRSLMPIINEAVRLDEDVPVHLKMTRAKTTWTNITTDITEHWITVSSDKSMFHNIRNITGTKRTPNDLTITTSSYEALPVPKFQSSLCASEATIPDVETLLVSLGQVSAENIKTDYIFGADVLNATIADTATSTQNLTLSFKIFTGVFNVTNAVLDAMDGINFPRLLAAMVAWRRPGLVEGLANASNLSIKRLLVPNGFVPPLVTKARNLISRGNIYFDTLNGINISELTEVVVKLDEPTFLTSVTFAGGLRAAEIQTQWAPVDLSETNDLGVKTVAQTLKSAELILPYTFTYPSLDTPPTLIIKGSATFTTEPKVANVNNQNLNEISEKIWLVDKPSNLSNRIFDIRHIVLEGPVQILGSLNSQSYGPWKEIPGRLLSRTKPQEINAYAYFKSAEVPNIISEKESALRVPSMFLDGLGDRTLRKNASQIITTKINFQEVLISDDLNTRSRINGKNLSNDIVRFDVEENIITGRKSVPSLYARNINGGLNFGEWEINTFKSSDSGQQIIKGFKSFANIRIVEPLSVNGLVNNRMVKNYLLKSLPQVIRGMKKINGTIYASNIFINGSVNDINVTSLVMHQLKKNKQVQTIKTSISTMGDITVFGNLVVNGLFHGVELRSLGKIDSDLELVSKRMGKMKNAAKEIQMALSRRAWYWNKLELIEENSTILTPTPEYFNAVAFEGLGSCISKNGELRCDDQTVKVLIFTPNSSQILFNQVIQLAGTPLVVFATSDPNGGVWIYTYENMGKQFHQIAGLNLPGARQASAIVTSGSLWLAVQLTWDTIILRYDVWGQLEEYTLPGTELFFMEIAPTGELLIYRSDGVWRLGGLSGPRHLFKAQLNGEISSFIFENEHYVQLIRNNNASLFKVRYIGD